MKKLLFFVAVGLISADCLAQKATVLLNNFDANNAILFLANPVTGSPPPVPAPGNVSVELVGGPSVTQLQPVTIAGSTTSVIPMSTVPGFFDGGVGVVPGVTAGATATFQLLAFVGTVPGLLSPIARSLPWTQVTGIWDDNATPPQPPTGPSLQLPPGAIIVQNVPEPSTITLGLLGFGALFLHRRKC